jgi:hypothetical protein
MKVVNERAGTIDYRLNLLGIRVRKDSAQLVAKWHGDDWVTIGPLRGLPVRIPLTPRELESAASDPLRLTAYQYQAEHPEKDLQQVLSMEKEFEAAAITVMAAGSMKE